MLEENECFEEILKILYEEDLIGLAGCGCPEDEYSPEAKQIAEEFSKGTFKDVQELIEYVRLVYANFFQSFRFTEEDNEIFRKTAERIWILNNPS